MTATPVTRAARKAVSRDELRAEVGQTAPDFDLPDQSGEPVRLSQLRGQKVVVYFARPTRRATKAVTIAPHAALRRQA